MHKQHFRVTAWDTVGRPSCSELLPLYYSNATAVLITYQIAEELNDSFERATGLVAELKSTQQKSEIPRVISLVCCKCDEIENESRDEAFKKGKTFAEKNGLIWAPVSSKTGENINVFFDTLVRRVTVGASLEPNAMKITRLFEATPGPQSSSPPPHIKPHVPLPKWIPDQKVSDCMKCQIPFSITKRKHHCRACGLIFCGDCSAKSLPIPLYGYTAAVRICDACYLKMKYEVQ